MRDGFICESDFPQVSLHVSDAFVHCIELLPTKHTLSLKHVLIIDARSRMIDAWLLVSLRRPNDKMSEVRTIGMRFQSLKTEQVYFPVA